MKSKLHLLWDMDGTLVDSGPEILATIQKSLATVGVKMEEAEASLRIGPPVKVIIRNSFSKKVLSDIQLDETVRFFRKIYDTSDYKNTFPFQGIDELIHDSNYVHHVITNKPYLATNRIIKAKGWNNCINDVITPDSLLKAQGRELSKHEMFAYCKALYPHAKMVGIGDMALDVESANEVNMNTIGVLWGTGTRDELEKAGCKYIVENSIQLKKLLKTLSNE